MKAKKSSGLSHKARAKWGQNFLSDPKILSKIAEAAEIKNVDTVVEIGPGKGSLTTELLNRARKVIAVEKDESLAKELYIKFSREITDNRLQIIVADVLNYRLMTDDYKLVGNIPYYITGEIFRKFLESSNQPESITFVVQKEVADRIVAKGHLPSGKQEKESILSISIKAYGEPKYGGIIKKGSFFPKPKVDSAIISVLNINKDRFTSSNIKEEYFFSLVKLGFAHKRKLLIRNLTNLSKVSKVAFDTVILGEIFDELGIDKKVRAEDLKVEDWFKITKNIFSDHNFAQNSKQKNSFAI